MYYVLVTAKSLANVKVELPSHKELKSTIDPSNKRPSSNCIYSKQTLLSQLAQSTLTCLSRVSKSFSTALQYLTFQQSSPFRLQGGWKQILRNWAGEKTKKHLLPPKNHKENEQTSITEDGTEFKSPLQKNHGMTIKGSGDSLHIKKCASGNRKWDWVKRPWLKLPPPFTPQVTDPNTFKLVLPVSAVILPHYELIITTLCLDSYWNLSWHLPSALPTVSLITLA